MEQYQRNWKNYYEILQVSTNAESFVISAAYKRLAQAYHPDTAKGSAGWARMTDINEAYEVLSDPARRAAYDRVFRTHYPPREAGTREPTAPVVSQFSFRQRIRNRVLKIVRWIAVFPAGVAAAVLVMFPIHWLIVMIASFGDTPFFGLLSARTVENLASAFTAPFFIIYVGVLTAPTHKIETGVVLAITNALLLGGVYVLAFTGGPQFIGWSSLYFGATPVLNLMGIATALYKIRHRYRLHESPY